MLPDDLRPGSERKATDRSLRSERAQVDERGAETLAHLDETADAVISKARMLADELLARHRASTGPQSAAGSHVSPRAAIEKERAREDRDLLEQRADEDDSLRVQRAEQRLALSSKRAQTDVHLAVERVWSDDAIAMRDEFLGVVTHDLRSMLLAIVGHAELIAVEESRENHADGVRMHVQSIVRAGARMNRLIGDLIDVASIEAGTLAVTRELADASQIVAEAVETFRAHAMASGITLHAEILPPTTPAALDPARILQVLANLLSNAIKFTAPGGEVSVRVERVGEEMRFTVRDSGVGIAADHLSRVFERFVQVAKNDRRGVGLGLYISKCIVQAHGGRIWAESGTGKGSAFYFTVPIDVS